MLKFDIITIFPNAFDSYFNESIIKRAQKRRLIKVNIHNLRDWTSDKHKTVDDKPYGGGPGMIVKLEPIYKAVSSLTKLKTKNEKGKTTRKKLKVILFSARGKKFDQRMARQFSNLDQLIMICGRYEGVDERVAKYIADVEVSIGDYILTGGELPAMIVVDAVTRFVPGVIKEESIEGKRFLLGETVPPRKKGQSLLRSYPAYTRPEVFSPKRGIYWRVPKVLLSGDHKKIEAWRRKHIKMQEHKKT